MYVSSPTSGDSPASLAGSTPAPMDTAWSICMIPRPCSEGSRLAAYPTLRPLQYMLHMGSSISFVLSDGCFFSHSSATLTSPSPMSWSSLPVGIASSRTSMGTLLGDSWIARFILAFRCPKRVPVTLVPPWMWSSCGREPWRETGILHVGLIIGNDLKTERKRRKNLEDLELFFFLVEGCWRVKLLVGDLEGEGEGAVWAEVAGGESILGVRGGGVRAGLEEEEGGDCGGMALWNELNGDCGVLSGATAAVWMAMVVFPVGASWGDGWVCEVIDYMKEGFVGCTLTPVCIASGDLSPFPRWLSKYSSKISIRLKSVRARLL